MQIQYKIKYKYKYLTKIGKVECVLRVASSQVPPDPVNQLVNLLDVVSFLGSFLCICVFVDEPAGQRVCSEVGENEAATRALRLFSRRQRRRCRWSLRSRQPAEVVEAKRAKQGQTLFCRAERECERYAAAHYPPSPPPTRTSAEGECAVLPPRT